jgi:hypothetical protein
MQSRVLVCGQSHVCWRADGVYVMLAREITSADTAMQILDDAWVLVVNSRMLLHQCCDPQIQLLCAA